MHRTNNQLGRLPIRYGFQPEAHGDALPLGCGPVLLPLAARNPDVYTHAGRVFQGGSAPAPFGLVHGGIMYSQIILDKLLVGVLNVLTLNKEEVMTKTINAEPPWSRLIGLVAIAGIMYCIGVSLGVMVGA